MKNIRIFILFFFTLILSGANADNYIKREVRATWMATVWGIDWPTKTGTSSSVVTSQKEEMIAYLDKLKAQNFNAIYFQVRSMCDAMYKSSYEPWSSYLTGTRGSAPTYDPLEFVVAECHKRGMECHAWVNPYRWASSASGWSTAQDNALKNAGMLLSYTSGSTTTIILNPGLKATNERIVNVCKEIAQKYDVDGIIFDDYFYPSGIPITSAAEDYTLWQNSGTTLSFADWRRANVNKMVADVYQMIQEVDPSLKFGIGPAGVACSSASVAAKHGISPCPTGSDWQYAGIFSDPVAWLEEGTIDYISPQIYWRTDHSTNPFGPITKWWSEVAQHFGRHHYASHSVSALATSGNNNTAYWEDYAKQVQFSRDYTLNNAPGCVFYSTCNVNGSTYKSGKAAGLGNYLYNNKFQHPSLTPAINWKDHFVYYPVRNLSRSGSILNWADAGKVKYAIYAIPQNLGHDDVEKSNSGGILSDYLIGVSYSNSFTLKSPYTTGHYYAVTVVDRFGNEFAPRYSDETEHSCEVTLLLSPNNGEVIDHDFPLKWSKTDADQYLLEVASDKAFNKIMVSATTGFNEESDALSYNLLKEDFSNGTYYWRITTSKQGFEDSHSAVGNFVIGVPEIEPGYVMMKDGGTYNNQQGFKLESRWIRSVKEGFQNIQFSNDGSFNRGFCVLDGVIYIIGRSVNSATANCFLDKYDATTGAYIGRTNLSKDVQCSYYPCNDIFKDDAGHLLVTNYLVSVSSKPIKLNLVNPTTGDVTLVGEYSSTNGSGRVDHCTIAGDVVSGNYTLWAAICNSNKIMRWQAKEGVISELAPITLSEYHPSSASNLGIGARVYPQQEFFVVNGSKILPTQYNLADGTILSTFDSASEAAPTSSCLLTNGFTSFQFGQACFAIYPATDYSSKDGYTFNISMVKGGQSSLSLDNLDLLWTVAHQGIGKVNNTIANAQVDYEISPNGDTTKIYFFVPGNGIASYRITGKYATESIHELFSPDKISFQLNGGNLVLGEKADRIRVFNTAGKLMYKTKNSCYANLQMLKRGIYLVEIANGKNKQTIKIYR